MADMAIVGGSLAGLMAALLLRKAGRDVVVYERAGEELSSRGAGIVTHKPLFDAMKRAGASDAPESLGVPCLGRVAYSSDGAVAGEVALEQTLTSWDVIYRRLLEMLPAGVYRTGRAVTGVRPSGTSLELRFANGSRAEARWVIGADGIRSTVRASVVREGTPEMAPQYVGYVAWRGLVDEARLSATTRTAFESRMAFSLPDGEQMLGYFVAGLGGSLEPGKRRFNWVWYRPAPAGTALDSLMTGRDGHVHRAGIPPGQLREEVVAELQVAAASILSPQFAEAVAATEQPLIQPIFDLESPRLRYGHVLLMGDAAFVARPHVGAGVTKAAEDAMALGEAFARDPVDLDLTLAQYERERLAAGRAIVARARQLGAYLEGTSGGGTGSRSVLEVLRETAVPP